MTNVLNVFYPDFETLYWMAEDCEGILLVIAYGGRAQNFRYLRESRAWLRRKYGEFYRRHTFESCGLPLGSVPMQNPADLIFEAYEHILDIGNCARRGEFGLDDIPCIEERAKDALYECLIFPDDVEITDVV